MLGLGWKGNKKRDFHWLEVLLTDCVLAWILGHWTLSDNSRNHEN